MTPTEIMSEAHRLGILLARNGNKLRVEAPKGALGQELREALAEHKAEILAALNRSTELADLPFPIDFGGLPLAQVEAAEILNDGLGINDPVMRKYNVLCWIRGFFQDVGENRGNLYEAIKLEQVRLGSIVKPHELGGGTADSDE